jgi:hypothetical protein
MDSSDFKSHRIKRKHTREEGYLVSFECVCLRRDGVEGVKHEGSHFTIERGRHAIIDE